MATAPAAVSTMIIRQGISRGPFSGFGGRDPRHPANAATAAHAPPTASTVVGSMRQP